MIKYKIDDLEDFQTRFTSLVDTSVDYTDYSCHPLTIKADYFGKIQWGKFTIYHQYKRFFQRQIILKIDGGIKENIVSLNISYHNQWIFVISTIITTLFCVFVTLHVSLFIGLTLLIITIIQILLWFRFYDKRKQDFIKKIEEIINKK
jgi:hypothetical protein